MYYLCTRIKKGQFLIESAGGGAKGWRKKGGETRRKKDREKMHQSSYPNICEAMLLDLEPAVASESLLL